MIRFFVLSLSMIAYCNPLMATINLQTVESPGGIKAWLVNEPSIPIISIDIIFQGGSTLDSDNNLGATMLMTALLEEGSGTMDATAFAQAVQSLGAEFSFEAHRGEINISINILKSNISDVIALLKQALINPNFSTDAIERIKDQIRSIIRSNTTDPSTIASQKRNALVFANHPYARPKEGTIASINALTRQDIITAHRQALALDRLYIGVVGDINAMELRVLLDDLFKELPAQGGDMPNKIKYSAPAGITVIDFDSPQAITVWSQAGIARNDADFFAAYVMNHILGGRGLNSRLTTEIRKKRGLTYGVYSYIVSNSWGDFIGGSIIASNDNIAEAIALIKQQWQDLAVNGVTEDELNRAKKFLTGAYPLRFDGNDQTANILSRMQSQGLPTNYITTRNQRIKQITHADIATVAKRLLQTEKLHFIIVGKPTGIVSTP